MLNFLNKPQKCGSKGQTPAQNAYPNVELKDNAVALLFFIMFLYNVAKMPIIRKSWRRAKLWLNKPDVDRRLIAATIDLKSEMRQLSDLITEFHKWTKTAHERSEDRSYCKQCRQDAEVLGAILNQNSLVLKCLNNQLSECNWLQYLHKYVLSQDPKIMDTGQLENIKRFYHI